MSKKILLDKINVPGIKTYEVYRQNGGYASVEKALKTMQPDQVTDEVKKFFADGIKAVKKWKDNPRPDNTDLDDDGAQV